MGVRQTRAGVVDLSYEDEEAEGRGGLAKDFVKPISLVELGEGHEDREHGTHQIQLGHGGVEFGGDEKEFTQLGEDGGSGMKAHEYNDLSASGKEIKDNAPEMNADYMMKHTAKGEDGRFSTFFVCHQHHHIGDLEAFHITKVEPIVTRIKKLNFDDSVVHHMSIYLCSEAEAKNGDTGRCESSVPKFKKPVIPGDTMHKPCYRMAYAHDRDAAPFVFPKNVGLRVGKGTPYTRIVQEWHYLLPKAGLKGKKFVDNTHFKLTMTKQLRPHNAAILGEMNMRMHLPPGREHVHSYFECKDDKVQEMLKADFKKYGKVNVFAVHLHAHNRGKKLWWDHLRGGKKIGEYGRFQRYRGYGKDESWMHMDAKLNKGMSPLFKVGTTVGADKGGQLRPGDSVRTNCIFDTRDRSEVTEYGTNHGEEMCGFLMMYYPHDHTQIKHKEQACIGEWKTKSP